ncbi:hypothetical protein C7S17_3727 [Burkholderia thailandensis]|nr:hypothetical protein [Burkholderia thailandensis]
MDTSYIRCRSRPGIAANDRRAFLFLTLVPGVNVSNFR